MVVGSVMCDCDGHISQQVLAGRWARLCARFRFTWHASADHTDYETCHVMLFGHRKMLQVS